MKIIIAVNHFKPSIGGCEYVCDKIARHLSQQHEVFILTRQLPGRSLKEPYNVVEYIQASAHSCIKQIDKIKPDAVLVYSDVFDHFRTIVTSRHKYRLFIALCGANWIYKNRSFGNTFYRAANVGIEKIICHSIYDRDYLFCSNKKLSGKTVVIPNGIDISEFDDNTISKSDLIERMGWPEKIADKKWVLNVSNFFPGKGQNHLVQILNEVTNPENLAYIQIYNDIHFTAIGQQLEVAWHKERQSLKPKNLTVVTMKNGMRRNVVAAFKQSNVFGFTSEKEVAPIVVLESMAASCPWVSANVGNVEGLQGGICIKAPKDSRYYSVFDKRVKKLFAEALDKALNQPLIAARGRSQIEQHLNWEAILPQYSQLLEQ